MPHYYVSSRVNVNKLMEIRGRLNSISSTKLSVNDFVIKAASLASLRVPECNSAWMGEFIRQYK